MIRWVVYTLTDWRLWAAWALAAFATATLFALISIYTGIDGRSQQDLCIARLQGDFDAAISRVVIASIKKDPDGVGAGEIQLTAVQVKLDDVNNECPLR